MVSRDAGRAFRKIPTIMTFFTWLHTREASSIFNLHSWCIIPNPKAFRGKPLQQLLPDERLCPNEPGVQMKTALLLLIALLSLSTVVHVSGQTGNTTAKNLKATDSQPAATGDTRLAAQKTYNDALALYQAGKVEEAISTLKDAVAQRPDDAQIHFLLGMAYSQTMDYKGAADSFRQAALYKPNWPDAHFRLGLISCVLGRRSQAIDEYKRLLELNSPLANSLYRIIKNEGDAVEVAQAFIADNQVASFAPSDPPLQTPTSAVSTNESAVNPDTAAATNTKPATVSPSVADTTATTVYKIGVGDVLDIRLLNSSVNRSSLYSVIEGGVIDLPIVGGVIHVGGLTTEEVQANIAAELKRRAVEEGAQVSVGIRQYASHTIIITGLVNSQGTKILRREAVPLYVVMAEAQPRLDAARISIMRAGAPSQVLDINDPATLNALVRPGDVINVTARQQEFYYIAGRVNYPGQKNFQSGITLLQAILAAGGVSRPHDNSIEVSREGADGRLSTTKFNLKDIKSGKVEDPKLHAGDRIEVIN